MAVDHAQRARWVSRVLRLREAGLTNLGLEDVQGAVERVPPETSALEHELGIGTEDAHVIGASGHPLAGIISTFNDLDGDDTFVAKLFDMSVDELIEKWRDETATAHEQMVADGAMDQADVDACYESQNADEALAVEQYDEMTDTGSWPEPHRLGHGYAMRQEAKRNG
jgi:hypothetical protein